MLAWWLGHLTTRKGWARASPHPKHGWVQSALPDTRWCRQRRRSRDRL